jgi:hypothetical protein
MGAAFAALKRGRLARPPTTADPLRLLGGQGGFEGASPQWAITEKPTQARAPFECNPKGCKLLGCLYALLAKGETAEAAAGVSGGWWAGEQRVIAASLAP